MTHRVSSDMVSRLRDAWPVQCTLTGRSQVIMLAIVYVVARFAAGRLELESATSSHRSLQQLSRSQPAADGLCGSCDAGSCHSKASCIENRPHQTVGATTLASMVDLFMLFPVLCKRCLQRELRHCPAFDLVAYNCAKRSKTQLSFAMARLVLPQRMAGRLVRLWGQDADVPTAHWFRRCASVANRHWSRALKRETRRPATCGIWSWSEGISAGEGRSAKPQDEVTITHAEEAQVTGREQNKR